jgi:hypothetical protein
VALPFMTVRVIYSLLCVFANDPKWFSSWNLEWTAILVHGLMGVLMEIIFVTIFTFAGLTTAPMPKAPAHEGKVNYDLSGQQI